MGGYLAGGPGFGQPARSRRPRGVGRKPAASSAAASGRRGCRLRGRRSGRRRVPRSAGPAPRPAPAAASAAALGRQQIRIIGPGQQGPPAPLHVQHQRPVHQHDQRAGLPARPVRRRRLAGALRPGQRRPVRLSRVGRRQQCWPGGTTPRNPPCLSGRPSPAPRDHPPAPGSPHPVHRAGQRELRRARAPRRNSRAGTARLPPSPAAPGTPRRSRPGSARRRPRPWSARRAVPAASGPARARAPSGRRRGRAPRPPAGPAAATTCR